MYCGRQRRALLRKIKQPTEDRGCYSIQLGKGSLIRGHLSRDPNTVREWAEQISGRRGFRVKSFSTRFLKSLRNTRSPQLDGVNKGESSLRQGEDHRVGGKE